MSSEAKSRSPPRDGSGVGRVFSWLLRLSSNGGCRREEKRSHDDGGC